MILRTTKAGRSSQDFSVASVSEARPEADESNTVDTRPIRAQFPSVSLALSHRNFPRHQDALTALGRGVFGIDDIQIDAIAAGSNNRAFFVGGHEGGAELVVRMSAAAGAARSYAK